MKSMFAISTFVLSAVALETRQSITESVTLSFANDLTGANLAVSVPADEADHAVVTLPEVYDMGDIISGFMATSTQLIDFTQSTNCQINHNYKKIATLDAMATFAELGNAAVDLHYVTVNCMA